MNRPHKPPKIPNKEKETSKKEKKPDTKWIDDVYKDLENDENSKGLCPGEQYYFLEIETLKKAILSHLPSRT